MPATHDTYHVHVSPQSATLASELSELWRYRELVWLFTQRNFVVTYKQTILGPLWLIVSPLLTSTAYVVLFGRIAGLSTGGVPHMLFYLLGTAIWTFFSACVTKNVTTFTSNAQLFGRVWFPRLIIPLSQTLGALIRLGIQLLLVFVLLAWYVVQGVVTPGWALWPTVPLALAQLALLGTGCGILVSGLTTRYRDLAVLVDFGVSLWMYATPVVYPLASADGVLRQLLLLNPITAPVEWIRCSILGVGGVSAEALAFSVAVSLALSLAGLLVFSRVEHNFVDTV